MAQIPASIFKAYDIRGVVATELTADNVRLIGKALGSEAIDRGLDTFILGRDGRLTGEMLLDALAEGITATGCNVKSVGVVPTPVVYFSTYHLKTGTGVMVTGSHNPPEYNGLKMMLGGDTLSGEDIQRLKNRINEENFKTGNGAREDIDVRETYLDRITNDVNLKRPLKIVIDAGNGVPGEMGPELMRRLGCDVTEMYCEIDGNFPNHHPDPSQPANLTDLIAKVKEIGADVGFGFDGDGDRLGVVTPKGEIIWPDRQMILFAQSVLKAEPGSTIIYDVKCTKLLPEAIKEAGGTPLMWRTGHSLIKAKLKETNAPLAGEMSGHIFFKHRWYGFDDALYTGARLCEILTESNEDLDAIFTRIPNTVNTPELRLEFDEEGEQHAFIDELQKNAHFKEGEVHTIDGLRVDFPYGFGLTRASNTTPTVIIRFEADNEENINKIKEQFRSLLTKIISADKLPF